MKKYLLIVLLMFVLQSINAQNYRWDVIGEMDRPVAGGQIVYPSHTAYSTIYVLGGFSESLQKPVDWIQEYHIFSNRWRTVGQMKSPRQLFVADLWGSSILYFGGTSDTSQNRNLCESWNYRDIKFNSASFDINNIFSRMLSKGHIQGDSLYLIGGDPIPTGSTQRSPYIVIYNLKTKSIDYTYDINSEELPRDHMTVLIGDNIFIFGGVDNSVSDKIKRFNITEGKLYEIDTRLLEARAGGVAIYNQSLDKTFIIGGYNEANRDGLSTVEEMVIDEQNKIHLRFAGNLNYARKDLMAVNFANYIVVFGGRGLDTKVVPYIELLTENPSNIKENETIPLNISLEQNYPNPFNPQTIINYTLYKSSKTYLRVFDIYGKEVLKIDNGYQNAGSYSILLNTNYYKLASGVYFYTLETDEISVTKKMLLIK